MASVVFGPRRARGRATSRRWPPRGAGTSNLLWLVDSHERSDLGSLRVLAIWQEERHVRDRPKLRRPRGLRRRAGEARGRGEEPPPRDLRLSGLLPDQDRPGWRR